MEIIEINKVFNDLSQLFIDNEDDEDVYIKKITFHKKNKQGGLCVFVGIKLNEIHIEYEKHNKSSKLIIELNHDSIVRYKSYIPNHELKLSTTIGKFYFKNIKLLNQSQYNNDIEPWFYVHEDYSFRFPTYKLFQNKIQKHINESENENVAQRYL